MAKKVLSGLDAARDLEGHLALVGDKPVDGPRLSRGSQAVFVDLEPLQSSHSCLCRVRHLGTA